ncbi:hypothetical protein EMCRGX_G032406 [Ephydatia muelleri]|eukprot:Em0019g290a
MSDAHAIGDSSQNLQDRDHSDRELEDRKECQSITEKNMQMGANGDHVDGDTSRHRRVRFREDEALVAEFDDTNLWGHDPNETARDMVEAYKRECSAMKVRPITKLLEQLERLDDLMTPIDTLDLRGVKLDNKSCEVLEAVLSRMQMSTLDLERTNLEDEGAIALCEMVEFYGCASKINLSYNNKLRARAWLAIGRALKKSSFITTLNVGYCGLEEQTLTLLLRSVRTNCALQSLRAEGNALSGKGTFILMAAMKFNENLRELYLANNQLSSEDGQYLGGILRTNHTLQVLDVRDNNLQDDGVRFICAGVAEQQEGLFILNLANNNVLHDGIMHISSMLPCTKTLKELNLSHNRFGDEGLYSFKLGLLANRSLEKLSMCDVRMTCEGAIALAEVLAEHRFLLHLDLKENDIRVAGLMALQLAHKMNQTLLNLDTPRNPRVDVRDRTMIKDMLGEIEGYSVRNRTRRDQKILEERKKQHESEHTKQKEAGDEVPELTVGGDAIPAKEVDPSLVGALEHVYEKPPGVAPQEDPFQNTIIDDKEKPVSLLEMEKSLDAMVTTSLGEDADSEQAELRGAQDISTADPDLLDPEAPPSAKQDDVLPDLVGTSPPPEKGEGAPPDVQVSVTMTPDVAFISHPQLPNLAANTQHAVDLLGEIGGLHQDTANQVLDHMN